MEFDRLGVFTYSDGGRHEGIRTAAESAEPYGRTAAAFSNGTAGCDRESKKPRPYREGVHCPGEGPSEESEFLLQGRLESQAPEIDGICLINDSEAGMCKAANFARSGLPGF